MPSECLLSEPLRRQLEKGSFHSDSDKRLTHFSLDILGQDTHDTTHLPYKSCDKQFRILFHTFELVGSPLPPVPFY